jgi:uncharacterized protein YbjQ (UPF0145 family)
MGMPVTTTFTIEGYQIREYKGLVRGIIVRSPTILQGIIGGANAIVGCRYDASEVVSKGSATEVLCYGTAVVIEKI